MALTAAEIPGAKLAQQGSLATGDPDVANAYSREFTFASPYGASKYIYLRNEVLLTTSIDNAATEYHIAGHEFSSPAGQNTLVKSFITGHREEEREERDEAQAARARVRRFGAGGRHGRAHEGRHLDQHLRLAVPGREGRRPEHRRGRGAKINATDARALGKLGVAHIDAALVPILVSPATVTGTAQQGQTLTAGNGTWGDEPDSYTYQWQHCDAAGANCTDIAGATAATYAVTAADVGFTLHVSVTATNRFGSTKSQSALTAAVT